MQGGERRNRKMRMTIVGKNPRSGGSECIVFGHFDRKSDAFAPVAPDIIGQESRTGGLAAYGGWELREMRPGGGEASAPALVGWTPGNDYCRTTGRLVVLSHRWSGRLQIDDIGRRYTVDLYSPETRLALFDLVNEVMLDITPLAGAAKGALALPRLTAEAVIAHLGGGAVWFRFLERDADYDR